MKNIILILLLAFSSGAIAQSEDSTTQENYEWYQVTERAEFPGGDSARQEFISKNMKIPEIALNSKKEINGTIFVKFIIEKDGSVSNVQLDTSKKTTPLGFGLEEAAIDVVKRMPKWKPATQGDKVVRMRFMMPIRIRIDSETPYIPKKKRKK
ncbi:MAG: TonB family protein [Flavobacteriales bacterium]|nr:TonB family protein [Flavobacteriales bacterium]